ncbi:PKD domain-containing protein [bacterium]|nr:PKD domain-containing protein [bacterium]
MSLHCSVCCVLACAACSMPPVHAATLYVSPAGAHISPYDTWARASTTIAAAVSAAYDGDGIIVSNGTYRITSAVNVRKGVSVQSLGGREVTIVEAHGNTRVLYLAHPDVRIDGLTLRGGNYNLSGAGVFCISGLVRNCVIEDCHSTSFGGGAMLNIGMFSNCLVRGNTASGDGGGIHCSYGAIVDCTIAGNYSGANGGGVHFEWPGMIVGSVVSNNEAYYSGGGINFDGAGMADSCVIAGNTAWSGAGVYMYLGGFARNCLMAENAAEFKGGGARIYLDGQVESCSLVSNRAALGGGGMFFDGGGSLSNAIAYFNAPDNITNAGPCELAYTCTWPLKPGSAIITNDPLIAGIAVHDYRLSAGSPCIDAGAMQPWMAAGGDLDGRARVINGEVDLGAYEFASSTLRCNFTADRTDGAVPLGVTFTAFVDGSVTSITSYGWDFDNNGAIDSAGAAATVFHSYTQAGVYSVRLVVSNTAGAMATKTKAAYIRTAPSDVFVAPGGGHIAPFSSWAAAATNMQDAIDIGLTGTRVLLTNGTHKLARQVAISNAVHLMSAPGMHAVIDGNDTNRCLAVYHPNALVSDVTITRGHVASSSPGGGGVLLVRGGVVSNAIIVDNHAPQGGGIYCDHGGTVVDCLVLSNNLRKAADSGGGVCLDNGGLVDRCTLGANVVRGNGAGCELLRGGEIRNSVIAGNISSNASGPGGNGGGISTLEGGVVENCTIHGNMAGSAGGVYNSGALVRNSIIYGNKAGAAPEYSGDACDHVCSSRLLPGTGNMVADPVFVNPGAGDLHVQLCSPCVDAGANQPWMAGAFDRDLLPRLSGIVDLGAYEQHNSIGPLRCGITAGRASGIVPLAVTFTSHVAGANTTIVHYRWDFDANGVNDQQGPALGVAGHTYTTSGLYSVTLSVSNAAGEAAAVTRTAWIVAAPSTMYVAPDSAPAFPYATWASAATTIGDALAAAADGTTIIVSNGTYSPGAQLDVTRAVKLTSLNGPDVTRVDGLNAARCLWLAHPGAQVSGMTFMRGRAEWGAGVYFDADATVSNCILAGNRDYGSGGGGGAYFNGAGRLVACVVSNNNAHDGGAVCFHSGGFASQCLIQGNSAYSGGGVHARGGTLHNSIVRYNNANQYGGVYAIDGTLVRGCVIGWNRASSQVGAASLTRSTVDSTTIVSNVSPSSPGIANNDTWIANSIIRHNYLDGDEMNYANSGTNWSYLSCCILPVPAGALSGANISNDPWLAGLETGDAHILAGSPCIDAGAGRPWMAGAKDIDGNSRIVKGVPDIGAYEIEKLACNPVAGRTIGFAPYTAVFTGHVAGAETSGLLYVWDFNGDGTGELTSTGAIVSNTYGIGVHSVALTVSNSAGERAQMTRAGYLTVGPEYTHVALNGAHVFPFDTWGRAATSISAAVSAGIPGTTVLITNGTFALGETVTVTTPVIVRGAGGAAGTTVDGQNARRCFYLGHVGARIEGLTIARGYWNSTYGGAGLYLENGTLAGCVLVSNRATHAAGVYMEAGTISNCVFVGNQAFSGIAGGVYCKGGMLMNCVFSNNTAVSYGGAVNFNYGGVMRNSLVRGNSAYSGAGVYMDHGGTLDNCTVVGNAGESEAGGVYLYFGGTLRNSIVWFNSATNYPNMRNRSAAYIGAVCCPQTQTGTGNITNDPLFSNAALGDFHPAAQSACINTGIMDATWMDMAEDLAGKARVMGPAVDMGAYEFPEVTLRVTPTLLDFGPVAPGDSATGIVTAANPGIGVVTGAVAGTTAPFALLGTPAYLLPAPASVDMVFTFSPPGEGNYTTDVFFSGPRTVKVRLRGTGLPEPMGAWLLAALLLAARRRR